MIVHVYTDASVKRRSAAWAMVAIWPGGERQKIAASGRFRKPCASSTLAEIWAIGNALHRLVDAGHIGPVHRVKIITDSTCAIKRLSGAQVRPGKVPTPLIEAQQFILAFISRHGLSVEFEWVKAHAPLKTSPHTKFNRQCDKAAKDHARAMFDEAKEAKEAKARLLVAGR